MGLNAASWLSTAVIVFGEECQAKLSGPGEAEAAIRSPIEALMKAAGVHLGVHAVFHDEVRDAERSVRPDYGVSVDGAISGYMEIKAPGHTVDPVRFTGHDRRQWERQRDLPNLVYTNGTEWRLFRDGELSGRPVRLSSDDLAAAGRTLTAPADFETLLTDFLRWKPAPITSVSALVRAVAPLTRLLRGEVVDQLAAEHKAVRASADEDAQPFTGLARDWRALLFPQADDITFADGYAQTVTFALLLARTEGLDVAGAPLHEIGSALGHDHSLMGKALQLLTDDVAADFRVTLDLLVRVIGAVHWPRVRGGRNDTYLHLYEHFLELYDNDLRKRSGSYYTPREVVEPMVRLAEEALVSRLGKPTGFRDPEVLTIDPAMGTGTFLHAVLDRAATAAAQSDGPGAVPGVISMVAERLIGFELQMGPFAVAELRTADLLAAYGASPPPGGMKLYVTDTLDDPYAAQTQMPYTLRLIAASRRRANEVKAKADVTVVIGNPPYKELAVGDGGWVEHGSEGHEPVLDDFTRTVPGRFKAKLKNLYVYFWRWATWKVWESTIRQPDGDAGVVCFISTSGYLTGSAFTGMREYLRRNSSEGWVIDLTPEGQTPDIPTRIFPGVRQPLAIGIFLRTPDSSDQFPATVHYRQILGTQHDKFTALAAVRLDDNGWRDTRTGWTDPLTPAAGSRWDTFPALNDLMPWYSPGIFPTRTWVYAPVPATLRQRWQALLAETSPPAQSAMFKEGRDATLDKIKKPLPGRDVHHPASGPVRQDRVTRPAPVRVGYRSFDRQWLLPDSRIMDMPRPDLWAARIPNQVFVIEQHAHEFSGGPGIIFSALIPDFDHFNNRGGRALPFLHPDGTPNLAQGLTGALSAAVGIPVSADDVLAYTAAVVASPAYTITFADELATPGIRVPITSDPDLWAKAIPLGQQVIWLHTYGHACCGPGRPSGDIRLLQPDQRQPLCTGPITSMPSTITYDQQRQAVSIGDGQFSPVLPPVWNYAVGGKNVIKSWFNYRKKEPGGKRTSPLDKIYATTWSPDWTTEFIDLLTVLTRLTDLEPGQEELLDNIHSGPLLSAYDLSAAGTRWPTTVKDRKPRYGLDTPRPADAGYTTLL